MAAHRVWPGACSRGSVWPRWDSNCSAAAGPEAVAALSRRGLPRLSRPEAPRHPDHRRPRRARDRRPRAWRTPPSTRPGGEAMVRAAVEGMAEGREPPPGLAAPCVLGVTVLTSDIDAPPALLAARAALAAAAGCGGLVCAAVRSAGDARGGAGSHHRRARHPAGRERRADDQARAADPGHGRPGRGRHSGDRTRRDGGRRTPKRWPPRAVLPGGGVASAAARRE